MSILKDKQQILQTVFGFEVFRPLQSVVIDKILGGEDVLLVLPTGGGKSLCYQLPALLMDGVLVVVSPLLALMQDQVYALTAKGVAAAMMSSMQTTKELAEIETQLINDKIKVLFIAPERLQNQAFLQFLTTLNIAFFAIDEAHCVSQWGHEFRADYRQLGLLKEQFANIGIAAFTATATPQVEKDIVAQLRFKQTDNVVRGAIYRDNLFINAASRIKDGRKQLLDFLHNHQQEQGIIYTLSRKNTESLSAFLNKQGLNSAAYHAGLNNNKRKQIFSQFINDEVDIMVATIAFGMGIDKSNIRFVAHMSLPKTLESYYQEIGRAGRDGLPCEVLLLYGMADLAMLGRFIDEIEDENYRNLSYNKLNLIKQYAFSEGCRHQQLSAYFDDSMQSCKTQCDNCLNPDTKRADISEQAKMFLSAVYRTEQQFGQGHIIDVLMGSKNQKVQANNHQNLSVYGIGSQTHKTLWRIIGDRLLEIEAVILGEFNVLKLTDIAKKILKSAQTVDIRSANMAISSRKERTIKADIFEVKDEIFDALRALRREIAKAENMPAYIIFDDKTLKEMGHFLPDNEEKFLQINGVGGVKLEKYGSRFLQLLTSFRDDNFIEPIRETAPDSNKNLHQTYQTTLDLLTQGLTIEAICAQRGFAISTILEHINRLVNEGKISDQTRQTLFADIFIDEAINDWITQGMKLAGSVDNIYHHLAIFKALKNHHN